MQQSATFAPWFSHLPRSDSSQTARNLSWVHVPPLRSTPVPAAARRRAPLPVFFFSRFFFVPPRLQRPVKPTTFTFTFTVRRLASTLIPPPRRTPVRCVYRFSGTCACVRPAPPQGLKLCISLNQRTFPSSLLTWQILSPFAPSNITARLGVETKIAERIWHMLRG